MRLARISPPISVCAASGRGIDGDSSETIMSPSQTRSVVGWQELYDSTAARFLGSLEGDCETRGRGVRN